MSATSSIPYNFNGKKLQIPLRAVLSKGERAFTKRKFTNKEVEPLEAYLLYFEFGTITGESEAKSKSKI